jgi:3-phosphoshikimate 1-carboxyvinyltransferase
LKKFGVDISVGEDWISVKGGICFNGCNCSSHGDHRIAMICAVMGLISQGKTIINGCDCIEKSFPGFGKTIRQINNKKGE